MFTETHVVLRTRDSRAVPLHGVTAPEERAEGVRSRRPADAELDNGRVRWGLDGGVEGGAAGDDLLELAVVDLELCGIDGVAKHGGAHGVDGLRPEVLVEVRVLLRKMEKVRDVLRSSRYTTYHCTNERVSSYEGRCRSCGAASGSRASGRSTGRRARSRGHGGY